MTWNMYKQTRCYKLIIIFNYLTCLIFINDWICLFLYPTASVLHKTENENTIVTIRTSNNLKHCEYKDAGQKLLI